MTVDDSNQTQGGAGCHEVVSDEIGGVAVSERRTAMIAIGSLLLSACAPGTLDRSNPLAVSRASRNKANYLAAKAAYNARDLTTCLGYYAQNHQIMTKPTPRGREHIKTFFESSFATWPDIRITVEHAIAEDDWVVGRSLSIATHSHPVMGVPASGRKIEIAFWDMHRFDNDGLIVETWNLTDNASVMRQIGVLS
jgi:steroid delta-isomerase-like uncharacterized protein